MRRPMQMIALAFLAILTTSALSSRAVADPYYQFSFTGANCGFTSCEETLTGSFSVPVAAFPLSPSGYPVALPNSDIIALSFTLTDPAGVQTFSTADIFTGGPYTPSNNYGLSGGLPIPVSGFGGPLAQRADGGYIELGCCNVVVAWATSNGVAGSEVTGVWTTTLVAGVPEPSTWAMLIAGFIAIGWFARRHGFARAAALEA